jgi:hypothetical protein
MPAMELEELEDRGRMGQMVSMGLGTNFLKLELLEQTL